MCSFLTIFFFIIVGIQLFYFLGLLGFFAWKKPNIHSKDSLSYREGRVEGLEINTFESVKLKSNIYSRDSLSFGEGRVEGLEINTFKSVKLKPNIYSRDSLSFGEGRGEAISILIAAKNEAEHLPILIKALSEQNYQDFEIVIIDDASTDHTKLILQKAARSNPHLVFKSIPKTDSYSGNKKNALTEAIALAQNKYLLFTDADCIPTSKNWISGMQSQFSAEKKIVLGYGAYRKEKTFLNKLIRYETLLTAWQYFSYTLAGIPYMGVGRNLAYTKSLFKNNNAFRSHTHILSGDDDLAIQSMANKYNTAICWQKEYHTLSEPVQHMKDWIRQKRRHITTATSYKPIHQLLLALFYISQFLFFILGMVLLFIYQEPYFILGIIALRYVVFLVGVIGVTKKLNEKDLIWWSPLLEFSLILFQLYIFILNFVRKPDKW